MTEGEMVERLVEICHLLGDPSSGGNEQRREAFGLLGDVIKRQDERINGLYDKYNRLKKELDELRARTTFA